MIPSCHYIPLGKKSLQLFSRPLLGTGRLLQGLPRTFCSPGWTAPIFSACLHKRHVPASVHPHDPPLDLFQQVQVLLLLGFPELDAVLEVKSQTGASRREQRESVKQRQWKEILKTVRVGASTCTWKTAWGIIDEWAATRCCFCLHSGSLPNSGRWKK